MFVRSHGPLRASEPRGLRSSSRNDAGRCLLSSGLTSMLVLALAALATPVQAFSDCEGALTTLPLNRVEEATTVTPDKLRARDIFGTPAEQQSFHRERQFERLADPNSRVIVRRISRLWRIRVLRSVVPATLIVSHRLVGSSGDRLQHEAERQAALGVRVSPAGRVVACRNATHQIIEGSADLIMSVGRLPLAGRYLGTIETDVRVR
jgi:hypothetical protein